MQRQRLSYGNYLLRGVEDCVEAGPKSSMLVCRECGRGAASSTTQPKQCFCRACQCLQLGSAGAAEGLRACVPAQVNVPWGERSPKTPSVEICQVKHTILKTDFRVFVGEIKNVDIW